MPLPAGFWLGRNAARTAPRRLRVWFSGWWGAIAVCACMTARCALQSARFCQKVVRAAALAFYVAAPAYIRPSARVLTGRAIADRAETIGNPL